MTDRFDEYEHQKPTRIPLDVPKRLTLREKLRRWVARGTNPRAKIRVLWARPPHRIDDDDDFGAVPPSGA